MQGASWTIRICHFYLLICSLMCCSCVSLVAPKGETEANYSDSLIDTWELMYQIDENGEKKLPGDENVKLLMKFSEDGQLYESYYDVKESRELKSESISYKVQGNKLIIKDNKGNTATWVYSFKDGNLIILWSSNKRFVWRRL